MQTTTASQHHQFEKKRAPRAATAKSSLRRAAVVSERPPVVESLQAKVLYELLYSRLYSWLTAMEQICTAYCTAEKYDLSIAAAILQRKGYTLDPARTGMVDQVIHLRLGGDAGLSNVFIFPSGNIVGWSVPSSRISSLATAITAAAETPYTKDVETEDLEYIEDPRARRSRVGGDVIILGTASASGNHVLSEDVGPSSTPAGTQGEGREKGATAGGLDVTLAKIAFSSGLARSTKLAVLETLLDEYLETTASIPLLLSRGSRLPFTRSFILRKTGELLQFRAQLNLYSELTDSLPDLFWDSRHELGLEGYYGAVGRALDVDVRIRQLNHKLDYASGIVEVLRERLSERHSLGLEWMIIILITVEVVFELMRLRKERKEEASDEVRYRKWKEWNEREGDVEWKKWKAEQERLREKKEELGKAEPIAVVGEK
jgi:uncharacterized Rmd1/YagE family protein